MSSRDSKPPYEPDPITPSEAHAAATMPRAPDLVSPSAAHTVARLEEPDPITPSIAHVSAAAAERLARAARYSAVRLRVSGKEKRCPLPDGELSLILGRSNGANVVIDDSAVSHRHVEIEVVDAHCVIIRDRSSENGTWITFADGRRPVRLIEAELQPGTEFEIGDTVIRFDEVELSGEK